MQRKQCELNNLEGTEKSLWEHFRNKTNLKWWFFKNPAEKVFFLFSPWLEVLDPLHLDSIKLRNDWVAKCQSLCSLEIQKLFHILLHW